jgi:hypothetical protein
VHAAALAPYDDEAWPPPGTRQDWLDAPADRTDLGSTTADPVLDALDRD